MRFKPYLRNDGPKVPDSKQLETIERINRHAQQYFAGKYTHLDIEFIWGVCYIDAYNDPAVRTEDLPPCSSKAYRDYLKDHQDSVTYLCRLIYTGHRNRRRLDLWGFELYCYRSEKYEPIRLTTGRCAGTLEETFDIAAELYLNADHPIMARLTQQIGFSKHLS